MTIAALGGVASGVQQPPSSLVAPDRATIADGVAVVLCGALRDWAGCEAAPARAEMLRRLEALEPAEWPPLVESFFRATQQAHALLAHAFERLCEEAGEAPPPGYAARVEEFVRGRLA